MPSYDGKLDFETMATKDLAGQWEGRFVQGDTFLGRGEFISSSCLCANFNMLWATALNTRKETPWTHWCMIHADMATTRPRWLDWMLDELDRSGADVLSAVAAMKTDDEQSPTAGLTNCGYFNAQGHVVRFSTAEVNSFPITFGNEVTPNGETLAINTGLWVCRFDQPWVEKLWFETVDKIVPCEDGIYRVWFRPEDWQFSLMAQKLGLKVLATRGVPTRHIGRKAYCSDQVWGHPVDPMLEVSTVEAKKEEVAA